MSTNCQKCPLHLKQYLAIIFSSSKNVFTNNYCMTSDLSILFASSFLAATLLPAQSELVLTRMHLMNEYHSFIVTIQPPKKISN
jgi:hypothetical protein